MHKQIFTSIFIIIDTYMWILHLDIILTNSVT